MNTIFVGKNFIQLSAVDSTNTYAKTLLKQKPPNGTVVSTANQQEGRGQRDRNWEAAPGENLTFSILLYPSRRDASLMFLLNKLTCLSICEAVSNCLPNKQVRIKWPNDIWVGRRKIAGILIENEWEGSNLKAVIIGIGLNINQKQFSLPLDKSATSLFREANKAFGLDEILEKVLITFEKHYLALKSGKTAYFEQNYLQNLLHYQEEITFSYNGKMQTGILIGVNKKGELAIQQENKLHYFSHSEITWQPAYLQ